MYNYIIYKLKHEPKYKIGHRVEDIDYDELGFRLAVFDLEYSKKLIPKNLQEVLTRLEVDTYEI